MDPSVNCGVNLSAALTKPALKSSTVGSSYHHKSPSTANYASEATDGSPQALKKLNDFQITEAWSNNAMT